MACANLVALLLSFLLMLKSYELLASVWCVAVRGDVYAKDLKAALFRWRKSGFKPTELKGIMAKHKRSLSPSEWPISFIFTLLPKTLQAFALNWLFRWPMLMLMLSITLMFPLHKAASVIGVSVLLVSLWIEIVHIVANRLVLGYLSNYFIRTISLRNWPPPIPTPSELYPSRSKLMRSFAKLFGVLVGTMVLGYAGVYTALQNSSTAAHPAFSGLTLGWMKSVELFYFSIATVATVGCGDIYPTTVIARFITASQVLATIVLVIFFLTTFTLTVDDDELIVPEDNVDSARTSSKSSHQPNASSPATRRHKKL